MNLMRKATTRRISTRTNTSLNRIDQDLHTTKKEEPINKNAIIIKNLSSMDPSLGKNSVQYSYIDNKFKTVENQDNYLDILDLDESIIHKEDTQAAAQDEYHSKKKKLISKIKKSGEDINEA